MKSLVKYALLFFSCYLLKAATINENRNRYFAAHYSGQDKTGLFVARYDGTIPIATKRKLLFLAIPVAVLGTVAAYSSLSWLYYQQIIPKYLYSIALPALIILGLGAIYLAMAAWLTFLLHDFEIIVTREALVLPSYTDIKPFAFWYYLNAHNWVIPYKIIERVEYYDDEVHPVDFALQVNDDEKPVVVFSIPQAFKYLFFRLFQKKNILIEDAIEVEKALQQQEEQASSQEEVLSENNQKQVPEKLRSNQEKNEQ